MTEAQQIIVPPERKTSSLAAYDDQQGGITAVNTARLLEMAVRNGAEIATLDKLMELQDRLRDQWAEEQFNQAMARFQAKVPVIEKRRKAVNKKTGELMYLYANMDDIMQQVRGPLAEEGLSLNTHAPVQDNLVMCSCTVNHAAGHSRTTDPIPMPIAGSDMMSPQQRVSSTRSYGIKLAVCDALGITTSDEDKDGNVGVSTILDMLRAFAEKQVTEDMILQRLGVAKVDHITNAHLGELKAIWRAAKDMDDASSLFTPKTGFGATLASKNQPQAVEEPSSDENADSGAAPTPDEALARLRAAKTQDQLDEASSLAPVIPADRKDQWDAAYRDAFKRVVGK